ncbi:hypothetical protein [Pseudobacteriovorax antillogorgiicola]|uniref:hypothetical protein n=1 Tax=Pseudobacteriovorax antillogorgiicola TaxID=1513793 RepID=UPI0010500380|nr:hypothetical protein [Pseudobacteriovorax antillogorgiicola]
MNQLLVIGTIALLILWFGWILLYGLRRGSLALILRVIWIVPLVMTFFPEIVTVEVPTTVSVKPIHVLLDDSESMKQGGWLAKGEATIENLKEECRRVGCSLKITRLSSRSEVVNSGYTPLDEVLSSWSYELGSDPWVVFTDGGNQKPKIEWSKPLSGIGAGEQWPRGYIAGYVDRTLDNVWIETATDTLFSFEGKNMVVTVDIHRNTTENDLPVQVQVASGEQHLATANVTFRKGDGQIAVEIPLPPLNRGNHFVSIEALPTATEKILWDNRVHRNVEVLPNTIGVLHLLGSPSWDGRFVRRYLKSEPKYDLISFFILRDPVDHQLTNERELSLIPFPVERLFNQELPNFRSVVLQNFSLYQFLEPSYQKNLVNFVKNGGGLLFIGGPRALNSSDYRSSALASILPFETEGSPIKMNPLSLLRPIPLSQNRSGPYYDPDLKFKVEAAQPDQQSRDLANVYDDWLHFMGDFQQAETLQGLHHMENVTFKEKEYTPLLNARLEDGRTVPLAVASYPGKGRALWIFSDSFWRLAMDPSVSRKVYYDFLNSSMTWLLRQEFRKPASLQELSLRAEDTKTSFSVFVHGPAAGYLAEENTWDVSVCGFNVPYRSLLVQKLGSQSWSISGSIPAVLQGGTICSMVLQGNHTSFGSVEARVGGQVPETYRDQDVPFSLIGLESLARLTQASLSVEENNHDTSLLEWVGRVTGSMGVTAPSERKSMTDFYWVFKSWWIYLLFLAIPGEVLVRRWPHLTTVKRT